jgi:predicted ATP-grasp superfamily ATP-dependent carboligase
VVINDFPAGSRLSGSRRSIITQSASGVEFEDLVRIFLYEHVTGGGLLTADRPRLEALLPEAVAIFDAVSTDFAALPDVIVERIYDARLATNPSSADSPVRSYPVTTEAERAARFDELARTCDASLLIAPETGGVLTALARRVEQLGCSLLSPAGEFCAWASDKSQVAETLRSTGCVPEGMQLGPNDPWPKSFPLPAVLKPNDGCGSQGVFLLEEWETDRRTDVAQTWRLERFVEGEPASVALIGGSENCQMLLPCRQQFHAQEPLQYTGSTCSVPDLLHDRFVRLLTRVCPAIPAFQGYIGLDVVLGAAADGSQDYVIEVNPRLTTSYVVLREMIRNNLAQLMLDLRAGRSVELKTRWGSMGYQVGGEVGGVIEAD